MEPHVSLDRLVLEHTGLCAALLGLDEATLTTAPLCGAWTARDVLAHVIGWDLLAAERHLPALLADRAAGAFDVDTDEYNAEQVARRQALPLATVVAEAEEAFAALTHLLDAVPPADLARPRDVGRGEISVAHYVRTLADHYLEHAVGILAWRQAAQLAARPGPRPLLLAAMRGARLAVERLVGRLPATARDTAPLCGRWTAKDVVGHLADWTATMAVAAARAPLAGRLPALPGSDEALEAWNAAHAAARSGQPWPGVRADYDLACRTLLAALEALSDEELAARYPNAVPATPYEWLAIAGHDVEHARQIAAWLQT